MDFRQQIEAISGHNSNVCFQCNKCSSGCPMASKMDLKPAQIMHSIRLGRAAEVLGSDAIWMCVGCETCTARCPQDAHPAGALSAARSLAVRQGFRPSVKEVNIYYKGFIANMRLNGKIHDASVAGMSRLRSGKFLQDLPLAWKLLVRGRIKPPPLPFGGHGFRKLYKKVMVKEEGIPL
ncbi:MAG: 4Fe-4S dicluster domain-containing protein [Anaerolineae bacterium]|nr:4Fe-4S dicluster domain-containing protein [Anaerolineae bacterium]